MTNTTLVMLPGTGSDAAFVRASFAPASAAAGWSLVAVDPTPSDLIAGYRRALDDAVRAARRGGGRLLVGGVSIGAAVAARWLLDRADSGVGNRVADGVVAVMPAWSGAPDSAPAAVLARSSAEMLRRDGLEVTLDRMAASSPDWLARTLAPSWRSQWPSLPDALDAAAAYASPTDDDVAAIDVPVAVVGVDGDPVHPVSVARAWTAAARRGAIATTTLDEVGRDSAVLGRCARDALAALDPADS
ncbi:alpha/beta hydrolase [Rhodococcoides corynebacterioides]|uniref:alpha/beta hydrolase n=1 Tax=Rhodococcoides corynebacterioides TaxID=53972 RepID=UPI003AE4894D